MPEDTESPPIPASPTETTPSSQMPITRRKFLGLGAVAVGLLAGLGIGKPQSVESPPTSIREKKTDLYNTVKASINTMEGDPNYSKTADITQDGAVTIADLSAGRATIDAEQAQKENQK